MTLEFLQPDAAIAHGGRAPVARSSMEGAARAAGARFEVRDGWNVAVAYEGEAAAASTVGWADVSHLGKVQLQATVEDLPRILAASTGGADLEFATALRHEGAWWAKVTPDKALALGDAAALRERLGEGTATASGYAAVTDLTPVWGALTLVGPLARETFARFTALDLRPKSLPVGGFRPGSIARTPGFLLREAEERYLMLFGAALGAYVWEQVADAATHLGGGPVGVDTLDPLPATTEEVASRA